MPTNEELAAEIAKLRKMVDDLTATIIPTSSQTTREGRMILKAHIEKLSKPAKKKTAPKPNPFKLNDIVQCTEYRVNRVKGIVQLIACKEALPSIKKCDKTKCEHSTKNYVWVRWEDKKTFIYHHTELVLVAADDLKPRIGKELSGRIGDWEYNAETKCWKRDGGDREYSSAEFEDEMYWQTHPHDKEDGSKFLRDILRELDDEKRLKQTITTRE